MTVSELMEQLKNAPAGSRVCVTTQFGLDKLNRCYQEFSSNDKVRFTLEAELNDVNCECDDADDAVLLYF